MLDASPEAAYLKLHECFQGYVLPMKGKTPDGQMSKRQRGTTAWKNGRDSFYQRPPTQDEVSEWAAEGCGIGAMLGERSGIVALEIDCPDLVVPLLTDHLPTFKTPTATSPSGGYHLLFRHGSAVNNRKVSCPVFNRQDSPCYVGNQELASLRGEGSLIVLPPEPGREWLKDRSITEVDPMEVPGGLMALLERIPEHGTCSSTVCSSTISSPAGGAEQDTVLKYSPSSLNLDEVLASDPFIMHIAAFLDLPIVAPTDKFTCPYHTDEVVPSANFFKGRGGYLLRCWHSPVTVRLGDFYHFKITGSEKRLRNSSSATWLCRLLLDSGFVKAPRLEVVPVSRTDGHVQAFYRGCILLHRCRLLYDPSNNAFPATPGFMAAWCRISEAEALNALRWLIRHDFLVVVERGQLQANGRRAATLYRFGEGDHVTPMPCTAYAQTEASNEERT